MRRETVRAGFALLALSGWLAGLFFGVTLGGALYLLLPIAAILFPWRSLGPSPGGEPIDR